MKQPIAKVRGMHDYVGTEFAQMQTVINIAAHQANLYGYQGITTPILEKAELFARTAGEASDVVMKEMYRFTDQGGEDLALRPEGTASVVRAVITGGLTQTLPQKFFYSGAMFRRERPQKGRLRQFHQCAVEYIGTQSPFADAETIICGYRILQKLNISAKLEINTLGRYQSRDSWRDALRAYYNAHRGKLSQASIDRITRNPLRILDSKDAGDQEINENAPLFAEFISNDEREFYNKVKAYLDEAGLEYVENPKLVRGLDYYNDTAFEFISDQIGAQGTVLAGGRYDGLSEMIGGPKHLPSVGWASGVERLMLLADFGKLKMQHNILGLIPAGDDNISHASNNAEKLRAAGIAVTLIPNGQMKQKFNRANQLGLSHVLICGDDEIKQNALKLKNMQTGDEQLLTLDALIAKFAISDMGQSLNV